MGLKVSAAHHDDTIAQLTMDTLIVQLLEELLKVAWEIHGLENKTKQWLKQTNKQKNNNENRNQQTIIL